MVANSSMTLVAAFRDGGARKTEEKQSTEKRR